MKQDARLSGPISSNLMIIGPNLPLWRTLLSTLDRSRGTERLLFFFIRLRERSDKRCTNNSNHFLDVNDCVNDFDSSWNLLSCNLPKYQLTSRFCFYFFDHTARCVWDLSSPTRDQTCTPCLRSVESKPQTAREILMLLFLKSHVLRFSSFAFSF